MARRVPGSSRNKDLSWEHHKIVAKLPKALSWRMQHRLHKRYVKLKARGKRENKAIVAIAREPSGAR